MTNVVSTLLNNRHDSNPYRVPTLPDGGVLLHLLQDLDGIAAVVPQDDARLLGLLKYIKEPYIREVFKMKELLKKLVIITMLLALAASIAS